MWGISKNVRDLKKCEGSQKMWGISKTVRDLKKCEGSQKVWDLKNEIFWNFEISKYEFLKNTYNLDLKSLEMLKNPLISIFGMRPRNIEVNDFVKKLSTPCSSRAILQTSAGFLGKWYSNDSGFNPLSIYINIVMSSIGYIESEIPFEIHSGEGQVGQSVPKWNAVSTSFFDER